MEGKAKKITKKVILYVILILLAIIWVIPMFALVATAIKSKGDFYSGISLLVLCQEKVQIKCNQFSLFL